MNFFIYKNPQIMKLGWIIYFLFLIWTVFIVL